MNGLYAKFLERNPAYDGKFLTGVLTTGIYCLPSCPARRPKRENVRFFRTPEEARNSGLRPCHRCRPDWFYRGEEWYENLYEKTAARVRGALATFSDAADIARAAGLSRTALNDLFRRHAHESPAAFLRRIRVEQACKLLAEGQKPAEAAAAAGFESSSAFHEHFLVRTGLTPGSYAGLRDTAEFALRLPAHYRPQETLAFYGRDPQSASERIRPNGFEKAALIAGLPALLEVTFSDGVALCRTDACDRFAAHQAIVRMLGLGSDAAGFERHFGDDPLLGACIGRQRGLRIPMTPQPWEALAWAIMGQQISLRAAVTLRRALIATYGAEHSGGLRAHPGADIIAKLDVPDLRALGFSQSKAQYLIAAATAVTSGDLPLGTLRNLSVRHAARLLRQIRGIGPWTVEYVFLRGIGFADCLPAGDAGLAQGLERLDGTRPAEARIREMLERFSPWRSLATYHVWASLNTESQ
jgi:AraC family transcriptional regulator of adaptative response / DNA-3-methyladenine glycosylase II